jgi:UPF0176 protein
MPEHDPQIWTHSAFYRFVPLQDPAAAADAVRALGLDAGVDGSIVLAPEGISGAVAGRAPGVDRFEAGLQHSTCLAGVLRGMPFKRSTGTTRPFQRLKVSAKREAVALGLPSDLVLPAPDEHDDSHLSPAAWRELLRRRDVVVLDNRNHFEYRLGHFLGAVDPQVHNFRDFMAFVQAHAPAWQGRPVAMYCTGGIRCDKTAPWLRSLGLQVLQLQGGILNYCQQLPDAQSEWQGECFVFDNRIALNPALQETTTTAQQVFDPAQPDEAWRLQRAHRLDDPGA